MLPKTSALRGYAAHMLLILLAGVLSRPAAAIAGGVEPWADASLPIADGLELWLDASRQNEARKAAKIEALSPGRDQLDVWHDGSGNRRDVTQSLAAARPRWYGHAGRAVVRFDGQNDSLALAKWNRDYDELTIVVLAAIRANPGDFRGLLAFNRDKTNDYQSGLNFDLGPSSSLRLETLNAEGAGFGGAKNLLQSPMDFGGAHTFVLATKSAADGVRLFVDGKSLGQRPRAKGSLRADRFTLGARFYNNFGPADTRGFLESDIAEVLVYNRALDDADRVKLEAYLAKKYADLLRSPPLERLPLSAGGRRLVSVESPAVQMFVPGFAARQLPVDLPNINNVKYRADGKLMALAYNGNVYVLADTNGDGLEDRADLFWDNKGRLSGTIGMALTPPGYKHGSGVFVASKGRFSLLVDKNGDDRADDEIVVATDWPDSAHSLDAIGAAFDRRDGSVYFALGTQNYANGYLLDNDGRAHYDIKSERGAVLRVAPDLKSREIACTGVRWPVGMAFNAQGDLFCTDQEGATWLPNGNPFDELLHIEKGRHYGFPPRHPKHLPGVVDEPSVFDYAPQHQSTCGINFNEPTNGGATFGPAWWRGDALVAGYSRGKLYRTKLVKSTAGYVARNQLIASLNMLTVDACVSPGGELVVATHSGGPDWGTGPTGNGKLYKIAYVDPSAPQPVVVWPQSPREVHIAFDRPLDPSRLAGIAGKIRIEYGRYVAAGDRFERHRPGYAVVEQQMQTPRYDLPVYSISLTPDARTLILATGEHREAATYAVTLPDFTRVGRKPVAGELPNVAEIDLQYDLTGVDATWTPNEGEAWRGWLPHVDLAAARAFTAGSAEHEVFWKSFSSPGKLQLATRVQLANQLRPALQPGTQLDYTPGKIDMSLHADARGDGATVEINAVEINAAIDAKDRDTAKSNATASARLGGYLDDAKPTEITLSKKSGAAELTIAASGTDSDEKGSVRAKSLEMLRPIATTKFTRPWATSIGGGIERPRERPAELAGGSWARGRRVFFSEDAACGKCHALDGDGGAIGPNLSNLRQRDYASVLRDVSQPSYAINPDYISYSLTLENGRVLVGAVRTEGDALLVGDEKGAVTKIAKADVAAMKPSNVSVMPKDLHVKLGPEKLRDLLTFLLVPPPSMPLESPLPPPPPRSRDELAAVLAGAPNPPEKTRPIRVVLVAGPKDHGPGEHDYPAWQKAWSELLAVDETTKVETAWEWPNADQLAGADVLVLFQHGTFNDERAKGLDALLQRGGGAVFIHWAVDGAPQTDAFAERIGLASAGGLIRFRHGPLDLDMRSAKHPIARNFDRVNLVDESYWLLKGDTKKVTLLGTSLEDGAAWPQMWTREHGRGRVFVSIPGHYSWSFDDPLFRVLLLRGIAWTAHEPVDRYNAIVPIGARMRP